MTDAVAAEPFDSGFFQDPLAYLARMREQEPVGRW
jgi:hypothetical protein